MSALLPHIPRTPAALLQGEYVPYEQLQDRAIPVEALRVPGG